MTKPNPSAKSRKQLAHAAYVAGYDIRAPRPFFSGLNINTTNEEALALDKDANDAFEAWWLVFGRHQ